MDTRIPPTRPDIVSTMSAPRPTATPPRVPFGQILATAGRTIVSGAESAVGLLPGGPMMATAIRGGAGIVSSMPMHTMNGPGNAGVASLSPEGARGTAGAMAGGTGAPGTPGMGGDGIQNSLQQAQEMNLYFLQIQEQVNQQNRVFTTLSNVMKAEHETVKTAIGNIR